jgi:TetR/AcrR family transcriptional repressor of nem operon
MLKTEVLSLGRLSKRADILKAGVEVLHMHGYAVTSVDSIAEAAGVPKGSFFNHFHSKEKFAAEAVAAYFAPWTEKSEAVLHSEEFSAKEKLIALLAIMTCKATGSYEGCMIGNMSLELSHRSEPLRLLLAKILSAWSSSFERLIREGQQDGSFSATLAPERTARFIVNLFQGAILRAKVEHSDLATQEFTEIVVATVTA